MTTVEVTGDRRAVLHRRIRLVVLFTIAYNLVEAVISLAAGAAASSVALLGFGLDSLIEVLSAAAVAWQFTRKDPERYEKATLRVIAVAFFLLAGYLVVTGILTLAGMWPEPEHSPLGLAITGVSVVVMPVVSWVERRAGQELGSATAVADSKQTLLCSWLSAAVLVGLALNSLFGFSWADLVATAVIVVFAVREGVEAWRGDACGASVTMLKGGSTTGDDCCD